MTTSIISTSSQLPSLPPSNSEKLAIANEIAIDAAKFTHSERTAVQAYIQAQQPKTPVESAAALKMHLLTKWLPALAISDKNAISPAMFDGVCQAAFITLHNLTVEELNDTLGAFLRGELIKANGEALHHYQQFSAEFVVNAINLHRAIQNEKRRVGKKIVENEAREREYQKPVDTTATREEGCAMLSELYANFLEAQNPKNTDNEFTSVGAAISAALGATYPRYYQLAEFWEIVSHTGEQKREFYARAVQRLKVQEPRKFHSVTPHPTTLADVNERAKTVAQELALTDFFLSLKENGHTPDYFANFRFDK